MTPENPPPSGSHPGSAAGSKKDSRQGSRPGTFTISLVKMKSENLTYFREVLYI